MTALQDHRRRLERALAEMDGAGLRRTLRLPRGIDLVSNDTLGLAEHPYLVSRMRDALASGRAAGAAGSRLLRGHRAEFEAIEARLAAFSGAEAALLFGSGYAANVGLLQAVVGPDDLVVSDALNHASLIDGIRLTGARKAIVPHLDLGAVEDALRAWRGPGQAFVVTESVFGMDGDLAALRDLAEIADRNRALVIVDEAHATGLYGARGSGLVEEAGLTGRVLATVHTGGKALGSGGAWVAGSAVLRDVLIHRARPFVFSTAPLPVLCAALDAALDLVAQEPQRRHEVHRKAALLRLALPSRGVRAGGASPIVPIVVGANEAAVGLADALAAEGFDVRAVRPPTVPPGTARLRLTVRYPIDDRDLLRLAEAMGRLTGRAAGAVVAR